MGVPAELLGGAVSHFSRQDRTEESLPDAGAASGVVAHQLGLARNPVAEGPDEEAGIFGVPEEVAVQDIDGRHGTK